MIPCGHPLTPSVLSPPLPPRDSNRLDAMSPEQLEGLFAEAKSAVAASASRGGSAAARRASVAAIDWEAGAEGESGCREEGGE